MHEKIQNITIKDHYCYTEYLSGLITNNIFEV